MSSSKLCTSPSTCTGPETTEHATDLKWFLIITAGKEDAYTPERVQPWSSRERSCVGAKHSKPPFRRRRHRSFVPEASVGFEPDDIQVVLRVNWVLAAVGSYWLRVPCLSLHEDCREEWGGTLVSRVVRNQQTTRDVFPDNTTSMTSPCNLTTCTVQQHLHLNVTCTCPTLKSRGTMDRYWLSQSCDTSSANSSANSPWVPNLLSLKTIMSEPIKKCMHRLKHKQI